MSKKTIPSVASIMGELTKSPMISSKEEKKNTFPTDTITIKEDVIKEKKETPLSQFSVIQIPREKYNLLSVCLINNKYSSTSVTSLINHIIDDFISENRDSIKEYLSGKLKEIE